MTKWIRNESGFTLLEMVCTLAIIALLAALVLPAIPRETSSARLGAYALEIAALLTADRNAAIRRRFAVATSVSAATRTIQSGEGALIVHLPDDVAFDALLADRCYGHAAGANINFFASGMSCGGALKLSRPGVAYQIRVNWLTGGVEVVTAGPSKN
jgi:general secretion pathway protein H